MAQALAVTLLAAALLFLLWRRPRLDVAPLLVREEAVIRERHRRERFRRYLQSCRGILRRENGLGVEITPRPGRPQNGSPRAARRRLMRRARRAAIQPR